MKTELEIRMSMSILATALMRPELARYVWGGVAPARERAWIAYSALSWAVGAPESTFGAMLEHVTRQVERYSEEFREEGAHADTTD